MEKEFPRHLPLFPTVMLREVVKVAWRLDVRSWEESDKRRGRECEGEQRVEANSEWNLFLEMAHRGGTSED